MTFVQILNDVGSKINQYSTSTDAFVTGFVTTAEAKRWINQSFEDIYKWYALANRGRFSVSATVDTVKDQAIYTFGGDAADLLAIESVFIKYASTDTDYTRVYPIEVNDYLLEGSEKVPQGAPRYTELQVYNTDTQHYVLGIEFLEDCIPDPAVTDGLMVRYIERPPLMSADADIPEKLPTELHKLIVIGASIPAFEKMGDFEAAGYLEGKYNSQIKSFFSQEQSSTAKGVKRIKPNRRDINKFFLRNR
jgi:hypothetical protein